MYTAWHRESLTLKEKFGTREGFEICPNQFFHSLIPPPRPLVLVPHIQPPPLPSAGVHVTPPPPQSNFQVALFR